MRSPKSSRTQRASLRPSRRTRLKPASIMWSSTSSAIAATLRSLLPVTSRKTSTSGSGSETFSASRSSPPFDRAASAAIWSISVVAGDCIKRRLLW